MAVAAIQVHDVNVEAADRHEEQRLAMHPQYAWKTGFASPVDPQVAGEELERLAQEANVEGGIPHVTPSMVVDAARPEDAPLHPAITWNVEVAAKKWQETEARSLIRSVRTIQNDKVVKAPHFVSVRIQEKHTSAYVHTVRAMSDEEMRRQVLTDAYRQLQGFKSRYAHLTELEAVFRELDRVAVPG